MAKKVVKSGDKAEVKSDYASAREAAHTSNEAHDNRKTLAALDALALRVAALEAGK